MSPLLLCVRRRVGGLFLSNMKSTQDQQRSSPLCMMFPYLLKTQSIIVLLHSCPWFLFLSKHEWIWCIWNKPKQNHLPSIFSAVMLPLHTFRLVIYEVVQAMASSWISDVAFGADCSEMPDVINKWSCWVQSTVSSPSALSWKLERKWRKTQCIGEILWTMTQNWSAPISFSSFLFLNKLWSGKSKYRRHDIGVKYTTLTSFVFKVATR